MTARCPDLLRVQVSIPRIAAFLVARVRVRDRRDGVRVPHFGSSTGLAKPLRCLANMGHSKCECRATIPFELDIATPRLQGLDVNDVS